MSKYLSLRNKLGKFKIIIFPIIGLILIVCMLGAIWFWETKGREMYLYEEVVVLKQDMKRGTTILNDENLTTIQIEKDKLIDDVIKDKNELIGLSAKHFIPKRTQLHPYYFENAELITDDKKFIFTIPNDWIYSVPQSLRRKDKVVFCIVNPSMIEDAKKDSEGINTYDYNGSSGILSKIKEPILWTTVAYVKDSGNREIVTVSKEERLDGSSKINEIEILGSTEDLKLLESKTKEGYKFIIMYTEGVDKVEVNINK